MAGRHPHRTHSHPLCWKPGLVVGSIVTMLCVPLGLPEPSLFEAAPPAIETPQTKPLRVAYTVTVYRAPANHRLSD
ncbi:hypothetical protein BU16DRAFT_528767 [Lophium mytilinum]|uniref:Uncharacterized protein n=1 Tax=Lophium mytilinum TaxID=390894 RepID=A0A6A6QRH2_9PEZI|nr:hypothetical protein BU16DRAFT_528767 [Lophium mytilinum]